MLKIKLVRFGKRNQPHYRMVVQEARTKRDGKYTAELGHYAPVQTPKILKINLKEYEKWVSQGAQPTETVASLVKRFKSGNPFPPKKKKPSKKQLAKVKAKKEAKEKPTEKKVEEETPKTSQKPIETPVENKPTEETKEKSDKKEANKEQKEATPKEEKTKKETK